MISTVERLGPDDGSDPRVVTLHPRRTAPRPIPRAWTEAIDRAFERLAVVREEIIALAAQAAAPRPAPEPIDPAPLIEAAIAPFIRSAAEAAATARQAQEEARAALATAQAIVPRQSAPEQVLLIFHALAKILAVRVLLFLSVIGSFALAVMAMQQQSWLALTIVAAFAALTIGPLAWLEVSKRPSGRQVDAA